MSEINLNGAQYCIAAIRCLLQEKPIPSMPGDISLEELYSFAKFHGVEAMVFHALEQTAVDTQLPLWQSWQNRVDMLMTQSVVQLAERDMLFSALPAAGIPVLPVKGCWLKEQYPDIDWRQMADLDMLIHPEHAEKAEDVMLSLGYHKEDIMADHHDEYLKAPYMGVELHSSLLPEEYSKGDYYADVWEKALKDENFSGVFRLSPEDEYIFHMLHMYKHATASGIGIRHFLDSCLLRNIYPHMDGDYLHREYEKLGLSDFVSCIEKIADCWFESGEPVPDGLKAMAQSILSSGNYGTVNSIVRNMMRKLNGKTRSPFVAKVVYMFYVVFLPLKNMQMLYPVLNKAPVLLPLFWLWRPVSRLLFKPRAYNDVFRQTNKAGDELWSEYNWQEFQSK